MSADLRSALERAIDTIVEYREQLPEARVSPVAGRARVRQGLGDLPDGPTPLADVVAELVEAARPGLMQSAGPRYYGFVIGGTLDAALVADLLASGWDQCAFNEALSPAAIAFEDVAGRWLKELLGLPSTASVGFTTGAQAANTVGLAAARWRTLHAHGWDVGRDGLQGAPRVRVIVGAERHATIDRAVRFLGLGERALEEVPALPNGALDTDALRAALADGDGGPTIVCAQAGNVNTGACDDLAAVVDAARAAGAWVHVDGAFGLWAAASPRTVRLVRGAELADSWACDGHKWLNVPYDAGYAICAHPDVHATALAYTASYLTGQTVGRELGGGDFVPESSRRARGFATWAALRSLGRSGVADLVDRSCELACRFAERLDALDGVEVVNEVVLNQVLFRVGDADLTDRLERAIQEDGTCWLGGTKWRGERLLRIAVSNWSTGPGDVDRVVATIGRLRRELAGS
ncbi:MAG TPA: aminotransferase class V-fold PLP-dependent enzyme [Candidatus Tectomicrobia bacterium]|nr:aminotransferase class V-fold PLP-dependent enzyme [Candidatus Tectomicrobia bacterium]